MNKIQFGNSDIKYRIKRSKGRKKTTQIVVTKTGVQILTIKNKTNAQISDLVKKNARWIYRKRLRLREQKPNKITYENNSKLPYLGKNYLLTIKKSEKNDYFSFKNREFIAGITKLRTSKVKTLYKQWLKSKSLPIFVKLCNSYSNKLKIKISKITVLEYTNRWGNVTSSGNLGFNPNLLRAPEYIIKYVVAHEVCHLFIQNHSRDFWNLLESIMPDYEERKEWLRVNRGLLTN